MSTTTERIPIHGLVVFDNGRVTIPKAARKRYTGHERSPAIGECSFELDDPGDGEEFTANVNERGQFYIPSRFRDRYDIEDGDYVDLYLLAGGGA